MTITITQGEYNALRAIWPYTPFTGQPHRVQFRTCANLYHKGLLHHQRGPHGHDQWWLTDAGRVVMDEYPHLARIATMEPTP